MRNTTKATSLKFASVALAGIGALAVATSPSLAIAPAGTPSAKATAAISQTQLVTATAAAGWDTILSNTLHTANQKDLFVDVSLESGLMTRTVASSKGGHRDTSVASAEVRVRCLI